MSIIPARRSSEHRFLLTALLLCLAGGLLPAGSAAPFARKVGGAGQAQGEPCRSAEIEAYLVRRGIVPPRTLSERRLADSTPEVRVIYLLPADKQPRAGAATALANGIRHLQRWYRDQLGSGKTFKLHVPAVEIISSSHEANWFSTHQSGDNPSLYLWFNSINEAGARFFDPNYVYVIYVDVDAPGQAVGGSSGVALLPQNDVLGMLGQNPADLRVCRWVGGLGHELGHALGLPHPPECDSHQAPDGSFPCQSLMYLGYLIYPNTYLLADHKEKLNQIPFIVPLELSGSAFDCANLLKEPQGPAIAAVALNGKKLSITGEKFGTAPRVLINNEDRTGFVTGSSDGAIQMKGKPKKLGLRPGDNTVQVFDAGGAASNVFILRV